MDLSPLLGGGWISYSPSLMVFVLRILITMFIIFIIVIFNIFCVIYCASSRVTFCEMGSYINIVNNLRVPQQWAENEIKMMS